MSRPDIAELVSLIGSEIDRARDMTDVEAGSPEDRAVLDRLALALGGLRPTGSLMSASHSAVERWVDEAVSASPPPQRRLAEAFRFVAPSLVWRTAYAGAPTSPAMDWFWINYAYAPLVSPCSGEGGAESPLQSTEMNLYLVVQGAGVVYGNHHHPAVEIYGIISGTASWLLGDQGFLVRRPGDVFVHHPDVMHATTTELEPTISWVAWLGDLESSPLLETANGPVVVA